MNFFSDPLRGGPDPAAAPGRAWHAVPVPITTELTDVTGPRGEQVWVRRSTRRRRSVSVTRRDGDLLVAIPASFSRRQEREWVERMVRQYAQRQERDAPARRRDEDLARIAAELSAEHLEGRARPASIVWSARQNHRWGSCTPAEGSIRISHRLQGMPDWVLRSVVMHELVHLLEPGHGPRFQELMARYPLAERARGFLDGVSYARDAPPGEDPGPVGPADQSPEPSAR